MKRSKYNAKKMAVDGRIFDSQAEGRYAMILKAWLSAGVICDLVYQPRFTLQEAFRDNRGRLNREITYVADFSYFDIQDFAHVVVDVKGMLTPEYRLKAKLFRAIHPDIVHREIKDGKDMLTHKPKKTAAKRKKKKEI